MVFGGDKFTLAKVVAAMENDIVVVIVDGSGKVASLLSDLVIKMEKVKKR